MHDWQNYIISQIAHDVSEIKSKVDELLTWAQRLALLALLWGAGILTNVNPEKAGEMLGAVIKSLK